jgi:prepilin-type N-terminal cleavage/methylation domain-containing protein
MSTKKRRGFTLVELLVVMVVISMLIALLLPAVAGVRERGRQLQCTNNLGEISKAILMYEMDKKHFPGWINRSLAKNPNNSNLPYPLSWPVVILGQLGRADLMRQYLMQGFPGAPREGTNLPVFTCPSDLRQPTPQDPFPLAYVANCGQADPVPPPALPPDTGASGLFMNRYSYLQPVVRLSDVVDGASETILLSENVGAANWQPRLANLNDFQIFEAQVGFVWWSDTVVPAPPDSARYVNRGRKDAVLPPIATNMIYFARPASNHPGIAIAAFCDGGVRPLNEDTDADVLRKMMTPNGALCGY